jgi:copper chaperone CopZ
MLQNPLLIIAAVATAITISTHNASAQVEQVTLRVDGLACPFCAYGLEKKLKAIDGFKEKTYEVKINEGKALFGWRDDKPLDIAAIETAVDKAGFTLKGIHSTIDGKVAMQEGRYFLVLPKPLTQRFYLYEPEAVKDIAHEELHGQEGTDTAVTDKTRERLDQAIQNNQTVQVVGPIHSHSEDAPAIGVEDLKVIGEETGEETVSDTEPE